MPLTASNGKFQRCVKKNKAELKWAHIGLNKIGAIFFIRQNLNRVIDKNYFSKLHFKLRTKNSNYNPFIEAYSKRCCMKNSSFSQFCKMLYL